jgi:Txe/YoeB family toxin of Txe-Axe toxin-antitoxin module
MDNVALKYRFSDFTFQNYRALLQIAKQNYVFTNFDEVDNIQEKQIIWRHDVEFSIQNAVRMAKIEHENGIKTTFFFQIHGDFYNLLEKTTSEALFLIKSLGHEIGLHFDAHYWNIENEKDLNKYLEIDKKTFEKYFQLEIKTFSFHNTNPFTLSCEKEKYIGMQNVYSKRIKSKYGYCSDSTGFWRYEILEDRLKEAKDSVLQILIHDGMWQDEVLPPRRRIYKVIDDHAKFMKQSYDETLSKFGAKNVDWDKVID